MKTKLSSKRVPIYNKTCSNINTVILQKQPQQPILQQIWKLDGFMKIDYSYMQCFYDNFAVKDQLDYNYYLTSNQFDIIIQGIHSLMKINGFKLYKSDKMLTKQQITQLIQGFINILREYDIQFIIQNTVINSKLISNNKPLCVFEYTNSFNKLNIVKVDDIKLIQQDINNKQLLKVKKIPIEELTNTSFLSSDSIVSNLNSSNNEVNLNEENINTDINISQHQFNHKKFSEEVINTDIKEISQNIQGLQRLKNVEKETINNISVQNNDKQQINQIDISHKNACNNYNLVKNVVKDSGFDNDMYMSVDDIENKVETQLINIKDGISNNNNQYIKNKVKEDSNINNKN